MSVDNDDSSTSCSIAYVRLPLQVRTALAEHCKPDDRRRGDGVANLLKVIGTAYAESESVRDAVSQHVRQPGTSIPGSGLEQPISGSSFEQLNWCEFFSGAQDDRWSWYLGLRGFLKGSVQTVANGTAQWSRYRAG